MSINNRIPRYRVWIEDWGNSEPRMEYIEDGSLHVYFGNWERGGYKKAVFQQFTGILDKFKKRVFEGDLIKTSSGIKEVIYSEDIASFECINGIGSRSLYGYQKDNDIEVIGNIFENKDLPIEKT